MQHKVNAYSPDANMMGNLTSQLTRTCIVCGIEKPLSAFLQLDSTHGTSYGKICAKCRSEGKTIKPAPSSSDDERSTAPSGIGIRGKEKIYADAKRDQKIHTLKELYKKEAAKKEDVKDEKIERTSTIEAAEKKHREFYIEPKKQPNTADKKKSIQQQIIEHQQDLKVRQTQGVTQEHLTTLDSKKKQHVDTIKTIAKEETLKTTTDFNNLFHGLETGRGEMQSAELGKFFTWLGSETAPIVKMLRQGVVGNGGKKPPKELVTEADKKMTDPSSRKNR